MHTLKAKILIVDDLPEKHLVYRAILDRPEYQLTCARSGAEALRYMLDDEFAVVLLDVNMPDMDGFETARLIRARKKSAHTPIIFVTAHADELHAVRGYEHGAVDYMLAPIVPEILKTKVSVFAELYRRELFIRRQADDRVINAEVQRSYLADTLEATSDCVVRFDPAGRIMYMNSAARDLVRSLPGAEVTLAQCCPKWALDRLFSEGLAAAASTGLWSCESAMTRGDGREIPVSQVVVAHHDGRGNIEYYTMMARDISERKRVEEELAAHRNKLEQLVQERTEQLEESNERLRLADRLAAVGTLAAGLGHDIGNLLMPICMRLDALEQTELSAEAAEDVAAVRKATEYLQRMTRGLRLFALNPNIESGLEEVTDLRAWWSEVQPFLRNALPKGVTLEADIAPDLAPVAMPPHRFTQAIYNLVQNAGDAVRTQRNPIVRVWAAAAPSGAGDAAVLVGIQDNGVGMDEGVRRRCLEPFFTTKARGISTGLGLALVHAAVSQANGAIEIESEPGAGASFVLRVPTRPDARGVGLGPGGGQAAPGRRALIRMGDRRLCAYVTCLLQGVGFEVDATPGSTAPAAGNDLVVIDGSQLSEDIRARIVHCGEERTVILGPCAQELPRAVHVADGTSPTAIREGIRRVIAAATPVPEGVPHAAEGH